MTYTTTTLFNGVETPIVVTYSAHRGYPGSREEPPEPAYLEIESIKLPDGRELGLPDEDMEMLEREIEGSIAEAEYEAEVAAYDRDGIW